MPALPDPAVGERMLSDALALWRGPALLEYADQVDPDGLFVANHPIPRLYENGRPTDCPAADVEDHPWT